MALVEEHDSADLLKEPARPLGWSISNTLPSETLASADGCRESVLWHSTSPRDWDILYTIHFGYQKSHGKGSELAISTGDADFAGPAEARFGVQEDCISLLLCMQ